MTDTEKLIAMAKQCNCKVCKYLVASSKWNPEVTTPKWEPEDERERRTR